MAVAVDVGGTNIRAALVDRGMGVRAGAARLMDKSSPEALLTAMGDCVAEVLRGRRDAAGSGGAMKGFVDHRTG